MDSLQSIILSVVEGITEFLPISSTGHLVLTSELLKIPQTDFVKSFEVIIQLGAILAVVILYWKRLLTDRRALLNILVAFIPTAVVGFTLYRLIKDVLLGNVWITIWALFLGGIVLILWDTFYKEKAHHLDDINKLSYKQSFLIGLFQSISIVPGVSRAGATIIGGLTIGLKRKAAVEFSFLLAIPTMLGATGLDLITSNFSFTAQEWGIISLGLIGSFITALFAVKYFVRYVEHHGFTVFGIYRIILALFFILFLL
ncbi:MAG: undecaprenyl-diphosphate phosphatase [Patescibacteria group bacterium]|mgnify:CR=1 FL=1